MKRIAARLDIKGNNLIKGICLEGLRVVGSPNAYAEKYYDSGIDELVYIDAVASLYGRNSLVEILESTSKNVFVPLVVGGGIRSIEDMDSLLRAGADRLAINTAAFSNSSLITQGAETYGTQCIVLSIAAKKIREDKWECYTEGGREPTGVDVIDWVKNAEGLGAGEIFLTSIDRDGTQSGMDTDLIKKVSNSTSLPVIASGGAGCVKDCFESIKIDGVDAVAIGAGLHFEKFTIKDLKEHLSDKKIRIRPVE